MAHLTQVGSCEYSKECSSFMRGNEKRDSLTSCATNSFSRRGLQYHSEGLNVPSQINLVQEMCSFTDLWQWLLGTKRGLIHRSVATGSDHRSSGPHRSEWSGGSLPPRKHNSSKQTRQSRTSARNYSVMCKYCTCLYFRNMFRLRWAIFKVKPNTPTLNYKSLLKLYIQITIKLNT
jgi:hypothetical protein